MAKNKKSRKVQPAGSNGSAITATGGTDDDHDSSTEGTNLSRSERSSDGAAIAAKPGSGDFLTPYKWPQGFFTRMGTAIGAGTIVAAGAYRLYLTLPDTNPAIQLGIPALVLAIFSALIFWAVGSRVDTNEFFISTEAEMKKVTWSSKGEIVGSTKVVLIFTLAVAVFIFVIDVLFMAFFAWIKVLQIDLSSMLGL